MSLYESCKQGHSKMFHGNKRLIPKPSLLSALEDLVKGFTHLGFSLRCELIAIVQVDDEEYDAHARGGVHGLISIR